MSIVYCDYLTGDDATGSGTVALPYKTITQASTSLTGGDEVRVAKSTATTTLSGTLAWVDGSASITTSEDLTSQLSIGDFVGKDTAGETWWEAITITDTTLTLYKKYSGTTETVSSKKLGITSTGAAAATGTQIQIISSSGSDVGNELKISGGWDLSTETQDGQTYFRQMHGTFTNRWGIGLYATGKNYIEIERLHFLRYYYGIYFTITSTYNILTSPTCNSCYYGIHLSNNCDYNTLTSPTCACIESIGLFISGSDHNTITTPTCIGGDTNSYGINNNSSNYNDFTNVTCRRNHYGIKFYATDYSTITTANCSYNSYYGIFLDANTNYNTITSATCNNNSQYGIYFTNSGDNTLITPICNDNTRHGIYATGSKSLIITTPTCNGNGGNYDGIYLSSTCTNHIITTPTCNNNQDGITISSSDSIYPMTNVTCNNNSQYGVYNFYSHFVINTYSGTGNGTADIHAVEYTPYTEFPVLKVQHLNAAGANKCFFKFGTTESDTTDARSGTCLKLTPAYADWYIQQRFYFKAASGVAQTLSAYIKDDAAFDGDIQAAIYFMGIKITGWTEWTPTTSYVKKEIIAAGGDISEDGVLELAIKCKGANGSIFVDDLGTV